MALHRNRSGPLRSELGHSRRFRHACLWGKGDPRFMSTRPCTMKRMIFSLLPIAGGGSWRSNTRPSGANVQEGLFC